MPELTVTLNKLHTGQLRIKAARKRYNVIGCGRRWGKTVYGTDLLLDEDDCTNGAIHGHPVAYFAPTYKMLGEVWRFIMKSCKPIISSYDRKDMRIEFYGGGSVNFWSLKNFDTIRGQKYKRVVIDEAALKTNLVAIWDQVIRPLLTDLRGDAYFLSTPKGRSNDFYKLALNSKLFKAGKAKFDNWAYFKAPTSDNPHIHPDELAEAEDTTDELVWKQEYLAEFTAINKGNLFLYSFRPLENKKKLVGYAHVYDGLEIDYKDKIYLSFDFNVDPITCLVCQHGPGWIQILREYRLENSDIFELLDRIILDFPEGVRFEITGDATGKNRNAAVKGNKSYYHFIKQYLKIPKNRFNVPSVNPSVKGTRILCNSVLAKYPNILIDASCKYLIEDLEQVEADEHGDINKDKDSHKSHLLDCFRYYINTYHKNYIKHVQSNKGINYNEYEESEIEVAELPE